MRGLRLLASVVLVAVCCHQARHGVALAASHGSEIRRRGDDLAELVELQLLEDEEYQLPQWGPKEAALSAAPNATVDAIMGNMTLAPLFYKDTKVINFDRALRMTIAQSTGTPMPWESVELLAVRPNTELTRKEFQKLTGDVGAIKSNSSFSVIPTVQVLFKMQTNVKGAPLEVMAKTLGANVESGQLLKELQLQLLHVGINVHRYESEVVLFNKKLNFVKPKTKKDKIMFPIIKNVTMSGCKKALLPPSLDDRNVGPLGWKNYSHPPANNMTFKGPFTTHNTQVNDTMAKLDFTSGQLLVSMDFKSGKAPGGTLLYLGGNATCLGLAVFVKGPKLGIGNTCSTGMETVVEMGIKADVWQNVKITYRWGKVMIYSGTSLKKQTVKHFVVPTEGKITIGAGGHNNGQGKFTFGTIKNVVIKAEAGEFASETPAKHIFYNCSDIPCRGVWVKKKQTCAPVGYCNEDIPCPPKNVTVAPKPVAVPVTRTDASRVEDERLFREDLEEAALSLDDASDFDAA